MSSAECLRGEIQRGRWGFQGDILQGGGLWVGAVVPSGVGGWVLRPGAEGCPPLPYSPHSQGRVCPLLATPGSMWAQKRPWSLTPPIPLHSTQGKLGPHPAALLAWNSTRAQKEGSPRLVPRTSGLTSSVTPGLGQDPPPTPGVRTFPDPEARPVLVPKPELIRAEVPS